MINSWNCLITAAFGLWWWSSSSSWSTREPAEGHLNLLWTTRRIQFNMADREMRTKTTSPHLWHQSIYSSIQPSIHLGFHEMKILWKLWGERVKNSRKLSIVVIQDSGQERTSLISSTFSVHHIVGGWLSACHAHWTNQSVDLSPKSLVIWIAKNKIKLLVYIFNLSREISLHGGKWQNDVITLRFI